MTKFTTDDRLQQAPVLSQGEVVGGRFVVKRFLAEGGMGRVYVAEQQPMERKVALKVMRRDLAGDERAVKRFFREAVAISKLQHPNTITLFDYGETDRALFIAMEFLDGLSLKDVLAHEHRLELPRAARIVAQIGLSLAEAHRKGVIHRDLKPDNIFVSDVDGQPDFVKVIDFGIAHLRQTDRESRITQAGFVCGTPEYMSPEQARGDNLTGTADLYSLGVILFELLEGRLPYDGDTPLAIVLKHQSGPVPTIAEHYPARLRRLVERMMATHPNERPQSAEEMLRELKAALPNNSGLTALEIRTTPKPGRSTIRAAHALADSRTPLSERDLDTAELAETLADARSADSELDLDAGAPATWEPDERPSRWWAVAVVVLLLGLPLAYMALDPFGGRAPTAANGTATPTEEPNERGSPDNADETLAPADDTQLTDGVVIEGTGLAAAAPTPIQITIESDPPSARLYIDGQHVGITPVAIEVLPDSSHRLVLAKEDHQDHQSDVVFEAAWAGGTFGPLTLTPLPARLLITSEPTGARVTNLTTGEDWGTTPIEREEPRADEPIRLELELSRYRSTTREIRPDVREARLHVELRRDRGDNSSRDDTHEQEPSNDSGSSNPFGPPVD